MLSCTRPCCFLNLLSITLEVMCLLSFKTCQKCQDRAEEDADNNVGMKVEEKANVEIKEEAFIEVQEEEEM